MGKDREGKNTGRINGIDFSRSPNQSEALDQATGKPFGKLACSGSFLEVSAGLLVSLAFQ